MPTYTYQAKDRLGATVSGLIEAANPSLAAVALREQGLLPSQIVLSGGSPTSAPERSTISAAPFLQTVPLSELAQFYRQFSTLQRAGVPILQTLEALTRQTSHPRLKTILTEAQGLVASGSTFSGVMERYPTVFTTMQLELIRAGEVGGMLEPMCTRLANYLEREIEIRRKLSRETLYPKIVLGLAGVVFLIVGWAKAGMGTAGTQFVQAKLLFAVMVAAIVVGLWWLARFANQFPAIGAFWDSVKMMVPGAGSVSRSYATARFCRALGALYAGGLFLPRAVEIAGRACGNRAIADAMTNGIPVLMSGGGLSGMLAQSGLLSPIAVQMARTGEQTGSLDEMMDKVADYLEGEADVKAHRLAVTLGVVAILIAAVVVLLIAVQAYTGYASQAIGVGSGE